MGGGGTALCSIFLILTEVNLLKIDAHGKTFMPHDHLAEKNMFFLPRLVDNLQEQGDPFSLVKRFAFF